MTKAEEFLHMPIPISMFAAVCALLGGATAVKPDPVMPEIKARGATAADAGAAAKPDVHAQVAEAIKGMDDAPTGERDAAGTLFDPTRHTGTKVKSGLWRMKTGVARGPNEGEDSPTYVKPGEPDPNPDTGTTTAGAGSRPAASATASTAGAADDEDEFAAFAAAAGNTAAPVAKARTWTDTDLSKLTNQAAQAFGSPDPVKALIVKYVPEGQTPHSRNIPAEQREAFAVELETAAKITYAG